MPADENPDQRGSAAEEDRLESFRHLVNPRIRSAPEQVASAVYSAILDGSLSAGTRLPSEEELAEVFEVSRPTVHVALRQLKLHGVISSSRGRSGGTVVEGVGPRQLTEGSRAYIDLALGQQEVTNEQLREVRFELELLSAASAAKHLGPEDAKALLRNEANRPGEGGVALTVANALQYDLAFHRILARGSHNPFISSFVSATVITYRSFDAGQEKRTPTQIVAHLDEVLAAVLRGDASSARAAMDRHLRASGGPCRECALQCSVVGQTSACGL